MAQPIFADRALLREGDRAQICLTQHFERQGLETNPATDCAEPLITVCQARGALCSTSLR